MFHVIALCKEILPTRHLDRSGEISTIICLQIIVSPVKDLYNLKKSICNYNKLSKRLFSSILYVSSIHLLLLMQKYEIFSVDCTQIEDLNNLCVRPTFACKQAKLGLD